MQDYGKFKHIVVPTINSVGFREFDLIIIVKETNSYYILKSLVPQTFDSKTSNINGIQYQHVRLKQVTNSKTNEKYSTRSWIDEVTITTNGGSGVSGGGRLIGLPMDREEMGGYGSDWSYDDSFEPGGSGGGSSSSNEIIIPSTPEDKIIIDKTFEDNECVKNIYDKLSKTKLSANYLLPFSNNLKAPNLTWKLGNITQSHAKTERDAHYNYTIILNKNNVGYSLEVASTIIHELIHATLYRWHDSSNTAGYMQTNFPGVWDYYQRYGVDEYQHNLMANTYVQKMVTVLKEFDNSYDNSVYEALAWTGLKGTTDYNKLSSDKKQQLENTLENYYKNEKNKTTCK